MEKEELFREILRESEKQRLFEATLRMCRLHEMAVSSLGNFVYYVANEVSSIIFIPRNKNFWKEYPNNNTQDSSEIQNKIIADLKSIICRFISKGHRYLVSPFVIVNNEGYLLIYDNGNKQQIQRYEQILKNRYLKNNKSTRFRNRETMSSVKGIKRVRESPNDEIKQWVQSGINGVIQDMRGHISPKAKAHLALAQNFGGVIKNTFIEKYKEMQHEL
jgi:hypothetical protein